jgi:broad specificity phosphatase PhoE
MFIHLDAVDRNAWTGKPDDRPLTELGRQQAERMAEILTADPIDALVSSPALRCPESMRALSKATALEVEIMAGFRDTLGYRAPEGWGKEGQPDPLGGAQSAGSAFAALSELRERFPDGRVVLCSYGDIIPALLAFISGQYGVGMPPRSRDRGAVFTVKLNGKDATLSTQDPPPDFPK